MKKDYDKIAEIERAIKQKYGSDAIQNPAKSWTEEKEKDYLEQLKELEVERQEKVDYEEKVEVDGFFVSRKLINKETNRSCPVCNKYSFSTNDDVYLNKYECCFSCYIKYVEGREKRWNKGWRPEDGRKK